MEDNTTFHYDYSAPVNKEVEQIRQKYLPREESKLEQLQRLDRKVQLAGQLEGLVLGVVSCLIFGIALCMGLDVLPGGWASQAILAGIGTLGMAGAYPLFKKRSGKVRAELAPRILALADEIEKN